MLGLTCALKFAWVAIMVNAQLAALPALQQVQHAAQEHFSRQQVGFLDLCLHCGMHDRVLINCAVSYSRATCACRREMAAISVCPAEQKCATTFIVGSSCPTHRKESLGRHTGFRGCLA